MSSKWQYKHAYEGALITIGTLKDENAELRELAKDACTALRGLFVPEWFDETVLAERMRELGIEVDDGDCI